MIELHAMRRHGFTLTELLVTIGIVGLMMGLLLPTLSGVRAASRTLLCQSNLRQMAIAAERYATLWDAYPPAVRYEQVAGEIHIVAWDWVTTMSGELVSPGPLWQMSDNPDRVMQCPDYHGPSNAEGDPYTGYNYNTSYVGGEAMGPVVGWEIVRRGVRLHQCRRTEFCAIFGCGGFSGGANKFMRAPTSPNGWPLSMIYAGGQAFRHDGTTNIACLDGHVAAVSRPKKGQSATEPLLQVMGFPKNGFLSDDDTAYDPR